MIQKQVEKKHYSYFEYLKKSRWSSFWYQLHEVMVHSANNVLEIGTGSGLFKVLLTAFKQDVYSVDIDPSLEPDYVASVTNLPFIDNQFDMVVCFQVLEHIPYEKFPLALDEICRVARSKVIISIPDAMPLWTVSIYIPRYGTKSLMIRRPRFKIPDHIFDGQHYWEINKRGYELDKVRQKILDAGLEITRTYRVPENTYHRFFVCNPN